MHQSLNHQSLNWCVIGQLTCNVNATAVVHIITEQSTELMFLSAILYAEIYTAQHEAVERFEHGF